jgi:hypothetical protein
MISPELSDLRNSYAAELRKNKQAAEEWWTRLYEAYALNPAAPSPKDLWPMGPASHPWIIATYRKYYFLCQEFNQRVEQQSVSTPPSDQSREALWGSDEEAAIVTTVEPKVFVLDMLSGGETNDLYEFLLSLVLVPIGLKDDEPA